MAVPGGFLEDRAWVLWNFSPIFGHLTLFRWLKFEILTLVIYHTPLLWSMFVCTAEHMCVRWSIYVCTVKLLWKGRELAAQRHLLSHLLLPSSSFT